MVEAKPIRVAVLGAKGRMGSATCEAVRGDAELELVAEIGPGDPLDAVLDVGADVAVDFTRADASRLAVPWLLERGVDVVVGTSGLGADDLTAFAAACGAARCLVVPNFALGAVLLMRFAAEAARWLPSVEIIELHHERKIDAPSGTAKRTAELIAAARDADGEVPIHSVRLPGLVAHQEVLFGGTGQVLTLRHDSLDRSSFMPGVVLAVKRVAGLDGLTVGLEHVLG